MNLSILLRKSLILSLLLIVTVLTVMAGCTSAAGEVHTGTTTTPGITVVKTTDPAVTDSFTPPEPTTAVPDTPAPVPETTTLATPAPAAIPEFLTFTNTSYGFSIDYPSDWQVIEAPVETGLDPGVPRGYSATVDVVEFYSPGITRCHRGECVTVQAELHVNVDPAPPTPNLDEYYLKDISALQRNYHVDVSTHNSMIHLPNLTAYELDYRMTKDLVNIHAIRVYTGVAGKVFVFTFHAHSPYSGEEDQYAKYSGTAETMFKSFRSATTYRTL